MNEAWKDWEGRPRRRLSHCAVVKHSYNDMHNIGATPMAGQSVTCRLSPLLVAALCNWRTTFQTAGAFTLC